MFSSSTVLRLTNPLESLPTSGTTTFSHVLCKLIPSKHLPSQALLKTLACSFAEKCSELILRIKYDLLAMSSEKNHTNSRKAKVKSQTFYSLWRQYINHCC